MKIAFVHGHLELGGIETLLLKLARELHARGHEVVVIVGAPGNAELERELRCVADVRFFPGSLIRAFPRLRSLNTEGLRDVDVLFACGGPQLIVATMLASRAAPRARILTGVFGPWEYFPAYGSVRSDWHLADRLVANLPEENIVFMSEACRVEHQRALGRSFARSPVIPLPVDVTPLPAPRPIRCNVIATVGRLVPFKPYPFHMLDVITTLRDRGVDVSFHIYGDGPERSRLERRIAEMGLDRAVHLHGTIDYSSIPGVLSDCQGFIGVGTAALEAAALGIPTIVGYEPDEPLSLGFFDETAPAELGDARSRGARYPLLQSIEALLALDGDAYWRKAELGVRHAAQFSTRRITEQYLDAFTNASASRVEPRITAFDYAAAVVTASVQKGLAVAGRQDPFTQRYFTRIVPPPSHAGTAQH